MSRHSSTSRPSSRAVSIASADRIVTDDNDNFEVRATIHSPPPGVPDSLPVSRSSFRNAYSRETSLPRSSKAGSQRCSRQNSRSSSRGRKGNKKANQEKLRVEFETYVNSKPEIREAIRSIRDHSAGDTLMPILIEHYKNEGKKPNIVELAHNLYQSLTPTEPTAPPPPQRFLHLKQQENHYQPAYPYDAEAMRLALLNLKLQDRSLQRRLIDPPTKFADHPALETTIGCGWKRSSCISQRPSEAKNSLGRRIVKWES